MQAKGRRLEATANGDDNSNSDKAVLIDAGCEDCQGTGEQVRGNRKRKGVHSKKLTLGPSARHQKFAGYQMRPELWGALILTIPAAVEHSCLTGQDTGQRFNHGNKFGGLFCDASPIQRHPTRPMKLTS
jgi:hypothetical protein